MTATVRRATFEDAFDVLGRSPQRWVPRADKIMNECISLSDQYWVGEADGEVACIFGLIPPSLLSDRAYLWLLTTDLVEEHKFVFIRSSQIVVEAMLELYPIIVGHCEVKNKSAIRWLRWLGATFSEPVERGVRFQILRKQRG